MLMLELKEHISTHLNIMYGKPTIKGTRIPVELIVEKLAYGETEQQLLEAYPHITQESIQACLLYAALSLKNELVIFV